MRLWHKDLIPYLPRQQLLSQWRECCCIARNISVNGTPNHILVNPIMDYPIQHFRTYSYLVADELRRRGYRVDRAKFENHGFRLQNIITDRNHLFQKWHSYRYLTQCYYNLQEKYDRGGIPDKEWFEFHKAYMELIS